MKTIFPLSLLLASATFAFGQNANQAAVDTLTKDVAIAVFANINQPKAQEIHALLLTCGDGCDPQTIIHTVGSWDQVGAKIQELSELKNTARFIGLAPAEANAAIRKQLVQFYARYKNDQNYGKPLSLPVQARILDKIDALLPPAVAPSPSVAATTSAGDTITSDQADVDPTALQVSQLERRAKKAEENELWMIIAGILGGLIVGAGAVYLFLYREKLAEVKSLLDQNARLNQSLDAAHQSKSTNQTRPSQPDYQKKAAAYDAIQVELGTGTDPLTAIRYLKQRVVAPAAEPTTPPIRSGEPTVELVSTPDPASVLAQSPVNTSQSPQPVASSPARSEVFYFPPPDPTGQFDIGQKSTTLSPESAYRFSVGADKPVVASFRFEAEPGRVARFLTYRNYMIEPACESENSYTATHTRITMRRDGQAVLENGLWRVKTKALIRYE